ncbi:B3/B4 domain-containing protein [Bacillus marasmi]|uniref:B3/B4 domain-containing protein n=1 Tax=Bacillus marasmi TaxID=1926279 RepID=UPI0011C98719|nr:phenylalanine--tRNA ligase beta subunit-related protein [Bacillus marasmi]
MEVQLSPEICSTIPDFKVGIIHYKQITVGESPQMLKGRLQLFQESIYFDFTEGKSVTMLPGIKEWREIFKSFGKDPNRYRHSAEALYRRVQKQNYLQSVHSAIDVNNFFSLQYQLPIGIYDLEKINGNVKIRIGTENEGYLGLNGRENSVDKLILSADNLGPFGSPFVDSARTAVTSDTTEALQIIYLGHTIEEEKATRLTQSLMKMFVQLHSGEAEYNLIGC